MKKTFPIILFITISLAACVKENTPNTPVNNTIDTSMVNLQGSGIFINGPYGRVSGDAKVYFQNTRFVLALENISISNGPDLHVYISKEVLPVNFIDLGQLQSTSGNQLYSIPGNPDFIQYKYALIHCKQYNHLFGSAELK